MMRSEFEALLPQRMAVHITDYEWELIEFVYTFHPLNLDKKATAHLYEEFGIGIFKDMEATAMEAKDYDDAVMHTRAAYNNAVEEQNKYLEKWRSR